MYEDAEGHKSGFLLYNNKTVCADDFTTDESVAMCRLLGFSYSLRWKAKENEGSYKINLGRLECDSFEQNSCILQSNLECRLGYVVFLFCTGLLAYKNYMLVVFECTESFMQHNYEPVNELY